MKASRLAILATCAALGAGTHGPQASIFAVARHWNGRRWSTVKLPGSVRGSGLTCAVVGPSDIWATGTNRSTGTPVSERWNGRSWRPVGSITSVLPKLTKTTLAGLQAVNALSGRNVWVLADVGGWWSFNYVGNTPDRYVLHRVHGRWVKVLLPAGLDLSIGAFAHVPHTSAMLAVGDQFTAGHFEGVVLAFGRL